MNGDESGKKSAGLAPARNRAILRAVVGAYLIYLGVSLLRDHLGGGSSLAPLFAWGIGVFFALAGAGVIVYTWRRWRADAAEAAQEKTEDAQTGD